MTPAEWEAWLLDWARRQPGIATDAVRPDATWLELGLGSREAVLLASDLQAQHGLDVAPTLAWAHPTPRAVAEHLAASGAGGAATGQAVPPAGPWRAGDRAPLPDRTGQPAPWAPASKAEPIAVVGLACRFPGAGDRRQFWDLLARGGDAITRVPDERWYAGTPTARDRALLDGIPRWGGLLDDPTGFDADFFSIAPVEAERMDPQQRVLLEVASDAWADAGLLPPQVRGSRAGVFVGASSHDFMALAGQDWTSVDAWTAPGLSGAMLANRLSYFFDLTGPSLTVDTACSSSLVAVHLACASLRSGESDLALAGGVSLLGASLGTLGFSKAGAMASDGRCKVFDARADGYVRSEGCAVVVLKRLSDARRDGSRIWGLIAGTATNSDGRSNGLMAPNLSAQTAVIRSCLGQAGVAPATVDYVECHGTGTALGDPIEVEALTAAYGARPAERPLRLGSVKSNLGHLEGAAGLAGLIKVLLALRHEELPASIHFHEPNPRIDFQAARVVATKESWPRGHGLRRAGLSSFGFGGSNAHAIIDEPPVGGADEDPCWVFAGQAARWPGMAHDLLAEPVFAAALARVDRVIGPQAGFTVAPLLADRRLPVGLGQVQPTLFALQYALAELWRSRGAEPAFVIGHSLGEVAAATVAGILTPEDGARVICLRSALLARLAGTSSMALADGAPDAVGQAIAGLEGVWVAGRNAPNQTLVAGRAPALDQALESLRRRGLICHPIDVDVASHCPVVNEVLDDFRAGLAGLATGSGTVPLISTVPGSHPSDGASHWLANLVTPVDFAGAVEEALERGVVAFVELSPHPALLPAIVETSRRRAAAEGMGPATATPAITVRAGLARDRQDDLPCGRAWRRRDQPASPPSRRLDGDALATGDSLVGRPLDLALPTPARWWRSVLDPDCLPYPQHHVVGGAALLPAAVTINTLLAAADDGALADVALLATVPSDRPAEIVTVRQAGLITLSARDLADDGAEQATRVATGRLAPADSSSPVEPARHCPELPAWRTLPTWPADLTLAYDGALRGWASGPDWTAVTVGLAGGPMARRAALLDAAFALPSLATGGLAMPVAIESLAVAAGLPDEVRLVAWPRPDGGHDLVAWDAAGRPVLDCHGLAVAALDLGAERPAPAVVAQVVWGPATLDPADAELWVVGDEPDTAPGSPEDNTETAGPTNTDADATAGSPDSDARNAAASPDNLADRVPAPARGPADDGSDLVEAATRLALQAQRRVARLAPGRRLAIVTRGLAENRPASLPQAALWGVAGVIAAETPERWAGIIDLPADAPAPDTARGPVAGHRLTIGDFAPLAEPVAPATSSVPAPVADPAAPPGGPGATAPAALPTAPALPVAPGAPPSWEDDDVVLVTGALGGVGRAVTEHLAAQGARALIVVTRRDGADRLPWLADLVADGVRLWVARVDLADRGALTTWLGDWRRQTRLDVTVAVHLAASATDAPFAGLAEDDWQESLAAKAGALAELRRAVAGPGFRHGLVFSSAASIYGVPGQAAYAAANALVDAQVRQAQFLGQPWRVVDWGPWQGLGLAAGDRGLLAAQVTRQVGWSELPPASALAALDAAWASPAPQQWVVVGGRPAEGRGAARDWAAADETERRRLICALVAEQLGLAADRVQPDRPLAEYGLDSILSLRIAQSLERMTGRALPATFLWNHPTVAAILDGLAAGETGARRPETPAPSAWESLLVGVENA